MLKTQIFPSTRTNILVAPHSADAPPKSYAPVDCDFTDDLEFASVYRLRLEIEYWSDDGSTQRAEGVITNIVTEANKEEFLELDHGLRIRLDHLQKLRILA